MTEAGFDITLKILNYLKSSKMTNARKLASEFNVNRDTVLNAVRVLNKKGHIIELTKGRPGGIRYIGKSPRNNKKLNHKERLWIIRGYSEGASVKDLTEVLNVSRYCIYYTIKTNNIEPNRKKLNDKKSIISKLYYKNYSLQEISEETGVAVKYLKNKMYTFVEGNRRNKVDRKKIKGYIISNPNLTGKEIAARFKVSEATVSIVKKSI